MTHDPAHASQRTPDKVVQSGSQGSVTLCAVPVLYSTGFTTRMGISVVRLTTSESRRYHDQYVWIRVTVYLAMFKINQQSCFTLIPVMKFSERKGKESFVKVAN